MKAGHIEWPVTAKLEKPFLQFSTDGYRLTNQLDSERTDIPGLCMHRSSWLFDPALLALFQKEIGARQPNCPSG